MGFIFKIGQTHKNQEPGLLPGSGYLPQVKKIAGFV